MPAIDLGYVVGPAGPQGATGATGPTGSQGNPGPNQVTGSTSTTLNGVLQGNGSRVSELASDSVPTENSNNIVRSGTIYNALQRKVNPNLLSNGYFVGGGTGRGVFPVNQRGKTRYDYAHTEFTIDRFLGRNNDASGQPSLRLEPSCVRLITTGTMTQGWHQSIPHFAALAGKTVTLSALILGYSGSEGALLGMWNATTKYANNTTIATVELESAGLVSVTTTLPATFVNNYFNVGIYAISLVVDIRIAAMKLELGSSQTLAHQENGVWVLNEIPNYEEELIRCQTDDDAEDGMAHRTIPSSEMIGPIEEGTTASRSYATGKIFVWNGLLYKAKTAISSGATLTVGTNCEQTTLAALLNM